MADGVDSEVLGRFSCGLFFRSRAWQLTLLHEFTDALFEEGMCRVSSILPIKTGLGQLLKGILHLQRGRDRDLDCSQRVFWSRHR